MDNNKTRAIAEAKKDSLKLFSSKNKCWKSWCSDWLEKSGGTFDEEIIQTLNIDINKPYDLYEEIAKSDLTISLYDLISWFNEQYNLIREKTKNLPELVFPVYKWEKGKEEEVNLLISNIGTDYLSFRDLNESLLKEYICRTYSIKKKEDDFKYTVSLEGSGYYEKERLDPEKKELLQEYYTIAHEFYDYIAAYSLLRSTDTEYFKSTFWAKGFLQTAIFGDNPFNNLEDFFVHYGEGGNVDGYFFGYKLGEQTLPDPKIIKFWDQHPELCTENKSDIINNPHILAKTLRVRKDNFPFNINNNKN